MGLPPWAPPQLRRPVRGAPVGNKHVVQMAGAMSYAGAFLAFALLTYEHCESNPTQTTYVIDFGGDLADDMQLAGNNPNKSATVEQFWQSTVNMMNTGRHNSKQVIPVSDLPSCNFYMQPALSLGKGEQGPAAPAGSNLTTVFTTRELQSFIIVTCVQKVTVGQAAGMSIGWFDKIAAALLAISAFVIGKQSGKEFVEPIELGDNHWNDADRGGTGKVGPEPEFQSATPGPAAAAAAAVPGHDP